jgi:hypothetical protein
MTMQKHWLLSIFVISFGLLAVLKSHEVSALQPFFKADRVIKLKNFEKAKSGLTTHEQELLELWESLLTGRSAPVSKWMKEEYKNLALNHLFTPSGFHLSAMLVPTAWILKTQTLKLGFLGLLIVAFSFLPGFGALKRMLWVKSSQSLWGMKAGFCVAMLLDVLFGQFQNSALSFSYSFLFLGVVYSGLRGFSLVFWLFLAQIMIAYFQGNFISPLLLLFSPFLNVAFALAMPILLVLSVPLCSWQLNTGLFILKILQSLVELATHIIQYVPFLEVHGGILLLCFLFLFRHHKAALVLVLFLSSGLNVDLQKDPALGRHDFYPHGTMIKIIKNEKEDVAYYQDGKCKRQLVRGQWWENCSPKASKRRTRGSRKKTMRSSYPS